MSLWLLAQVVDYFQTNNPDIETLTHQNDLAGVTLSLGPSSSKP